MFRIFDQSKLILFGPSSSLSNAKDILWGPHDPALSPASEAWIPWSPKSTLSEHHTAFFLEHVALKHLKTPKPALLRQI